ncbi:MAG: biopolymer transporter ExbD [Lentisphaeria bacterium]|jgi:biopolymer transport protein ExbD|nr:biopolymer transporter ExbD [Lentisphaeria bacterium]MDY0176096.1 biopolymer transporter ExbD [Lentisphaeria bacterium]NLZ60365.1 biopolymer transporter ExbD [Lentisphaerota bacterium]
MKRHDEDLQTPITAMIDIVFQLIIYFVVTSSVDKDMVDESIRLAEADHSPAVESSDPRLVVINVNAQGRVNVALQPMSMQQLENLLLSMKVQSGSSVPILIRCDGNTRFDYVDQVMQRAARVGLYRVRIAAMVEG